MSELYTSLTRLKMSLNNGQMPPMTPLTEAAKLVCDPAFTIGMGALNEDEEKGLQCPVIGCGKWLHRLSTHLTLVHRDIGGVDSVRRALDLHSTVALQSAQERADVKRRTSGYRPSPEQGRRARAKAHTPDSQAKKGATKSRNAYRIGVRNLRDTCEMQLRHKFIDFANEIGRSPTKREFISRFGEQATRNAMRVYGSWNNALTHFGLDVRPYPARMDRHDPILSVLPSLRAWYAVHGDLPCDRDLHRVGMPLLHSRRTYLKAFRTGSWPHAMQKAATLLQIYGGRYGIPEHLKLKSKKGRAA